MVKIVLKNKLALVLIGIIILLIGLCIYLGISNYNYNKTNIVVCELTEEMKEDAATKYTKNLIYYSHDGVILELKSSIKMKYSNQSVYEVAKIPFKEVKEVTFDDKKMLINLAEVSYDKNNFDVLKEDIWYKEYVKLYEGMGFECKEK